MKAPLLLLLLLAACRDPATLSGTALLVTTDSSDVEVDQLRFEGFIVDGGALFGPTARPERPDGRLPATTTVRVLVRDELAGQSAQVVVTGFLRDTAVAAGEGRVTVERGVERGVVVKLGVSGCADCQGCCADGVCVSPPSAAACGAGGAACVACDAQLADRCSGAGQCACGAGPSCRLSLGADRCANGRCQCGQGPSCEPGQECLAQTCQCTPSSCAGCCLGNRCITAPSSSACGTGGRACLDCGGSTCAAGQCAMSACNAATCPTGCCIGATCVTAQTAIACGAGGQACASCGAGSCDGGVCLGSCDPSSCPSGCCAGGQCVAGTSASACGRGGGACVSCSGACTNQRCETPCGPASCPTGCCQGGVCQPGTSASACGAAGSACQACGAGSACQAGQCVVASACSSVSCLRGCCDGTTCRLSTSTTCGLQGTACASCATTIADRCNANGDCVCGLGSACLPGQACRGGQCVCDPSTCGGCCDGAICQPGTAKNRCGFDGGVCANCTGSRSCVNAVCQ